MEVNPNLSVYLCSYQRTAYLSSSEVAGLGSIENRQGTVAVVVVGVTPHQGERESRSQGKGPQVKSFKTV